MNIDDVAGAVSKAGTKVGAQAGMAGLIGAASAGKFAVDSVTGEKLVMDLGTMRDKVDAMLNRVSRLGNQEVRLGDLPEAQAVSKLDQMVAVGGDRSLLTVLTQFRDSLDQAMEGVRLGMANYDQVESETRETFERGLQEKNVSKPRPMWA